MESGLSYVEHQTENYFAFYSLRPNNAAYVDRVIYSGIDYIKILFSES